MANFLKILMQINFSAPDQGRHIFNWQTGNPSRMLNHVPVLHLYQKPRFGLETYSSSVKLLELQ